MSPVLRFMNQTEMQLECYTVDMNPESLYLAWPIDYGVVPPPNIQHSVKISSTVAYSTEDSIVLKARVNVCLYVV